jgi:hypothetical protein
MDVLGAKMMKKQDEWLEYEGTIERQTEKAILFWRAGQDKPEWMPKSQLVILEPSSPEHPQAVIKVTKWIAGQKGWL